MRRSNSSIGTEDTFTRVTFQALVEAVIPPAFRNSEVGVEPIAGAVQLGVDQFVIRELDQSQFIPVNENLIQVPLSSSTAQMLNLGAQQLILRGFTQHPFNACAWIFPRGGLFAALSRVDRLQTLALLDRLDIPLYMLPYPYQNSPAMIQTMIDSLNQLTMFGYYSEWFGYGTTRLFPPDDRQVECFPPGWRLSAYPGPAYAYRDLRGFLLKYPHDKGEFE